MLKVFTLLCTFLAAALARDHRTFEVMVPMRDGVKLHTRVALPRNYMDTKQKVVTIVDRSPYGQDALELMVDMLLPFGFATIGQDMRGTQLSEGNFSIWHSDGNDSYDLGQWVIQQEWSNGIIYSFGASADGLASFAMLESSPEWLKAQYIIWASSTGYDVIYPNGAYLQALGDMWIRSTVDDTAEECLQILYDNEMRTDWWIPLDLKGNFGLGHGRSGFWAGWYDIFLTGNLIAYNGYNYESDPSVRYTSKITVDPLGHCQAAAEYFTENVIAGRTALGLQQMLEVYGVLPETRNNIKNVTFYVMSSNDAIGKQVGQYWTSLEAFPKPTMVRFFAHPDGTASTFKPAAGEGAESSSYVYDPKNTIPTTGGNNLQLPCGPLDQSAIDKRADVVNFQTEFFVEEVALTGPLFATLFVSSDAIDTDFMVRISDVYPTGEARLIQDSAVRMRWRDGGLEPKYMTKGEVYKAQMSLWNTSYVVAPGHALRFSVSSSNAPRFSVNRNNGVLLGAADQGEYITASNTIFHSEKYPTYFSLPVVDRALQLPEVHDILGEVAKAYPKLDMDVMMKKMPEIVAALTKWGKH